MQRRCKCHACIFHALKDVSVACQEVYGKRYAETHPQVEQLRQAIQHIFAAKTKRTAEKRYATLIALRDQFVQDKPQAPAIFDFLERHGLAPTGLAHLGEWHREPDHPQDQPVLTAGQCNAVEQVIRRFDQHYQNFCGFESIETAQAYLGIFKKMYRLTHFSDDAQPRIRGKCPLELAGYDLGQLPLAALGGGLSIEWPMEATGEDVPNL